MFPKLQIYILYILCCNHILTVSSEETCERGFESFTQRYLLFNVNPGEGFNLRRDVYLRIANLVHKLNDIEPWTLVLPPWGNLYHWKNTPRLVFYPWGEFFDIGSLQKWIPVMEFEDFWNGENGHVDSAYILQNFEDMWEKDWVERYEVAKCFDKQVYRKNSDGKWFNTLWNRPVTFSNFSCLSFQGMAKTIIPFLTKDIKNSKSVFLDRGEILLHDDFGTWRHWAARRSMRFAAPLVREAAEFRRRFLESDDAADKTRVADDWRDFKPKPGSAIGGPYLSTHLRRRDFLRARKDEVPSLEEAAKQLSKLLRELNLRKIFVATDAPEEELDELRSYLHDFEVFTFTPSEEFMQRFGDGGAAIVDQIICSHSRYFIGTFESTFSFRIQEEREILGFGPETSFNRLCGSNPTCEQPTQWKIVYS